VLNTKDYYKEFDTRYETQMEQLQDNIYSNTLNIDIRIKSLFDYTRYLGRYYGLNIKQLYTISAKRLKNIHEGVDVGKVLVKDSAYLSVLQAALEGIIIAKQNLEQDTINFGIISKYKLKYEVYRDITNMYNEYIVKELLIGRKVYIGNGLGSLVIKIIKGKSKEEINTISWKESSIKKREILSRGGIPFLKKDAINNPDYKGEQWCVKTNKDHYPFICWVGRASSCWAGYYNFNATRDNNTPNTMEELIATTNSIKEIDNLNIGIVKKLSLYLSVNPKHIANYTR